MSLASVSRDTFAISHYFATHRRSRIALAWNTRCSAPAHVLFRECSSWTQGARGRSCRQVRGPCSARLARLAAIQIILPRRACCAFAAVVAMESSHTDAIGLGDATSRARSVEWAPKAVARPIPVLVCGYRTRGALVCSCYRHCAGQKTDARHEDPSISYNVLLYL